MSRSAAAGAGSSASPSSAPSTGSGASQLTPAQLTAQFNVKKQELTAIAQKIGELETESDEHTLVIDTMVPLNPDRKCFRLVGGVLVERTIKEVLPALEANRSGLNQVISQLISTYKSKEEEFQKFQKQHGIQIGSKA